MHKNAHLGGCVAVFLIGSLNCNSIFHTIYWHSHLSRIQIISILSYKILAAGEANEVGKNIAVAYSNILNINVTLHVAVDSYDLISSVPTFFVPEDNYIRAHVQLIN